MGSRPRLDGSVYYALPQSFAASQFARIGRSLADLIAANGFLETFDQLGGCPQLDPRMPAQTVFAFHVKNGDGYLAHVDLMRLYRALNQDVTAALTADTNAGERELAAQLCHIGKPVKLGAQSVLRIAPGVRTVSQSWSVDAAAAERNTQAILLGCATVIAKIDLLLRHGFLGK